MYPPLTSANTPHRKVGQRGRPTAQVAASIPHQRRAARAPSRGLWLLQPQDLGGHQTCPGYESGLERYGLSGSKNQRLAGPTRLLKRRAPPCWRIALVTLDGLTTETVRSLATPRPPRHQSRSASSTAEQPGAASRSRQPGRPSPRPQSARYQCRLARRSSLPSPLPPDPTSTGLQAMHRQRPVQAHNHAIDCRLIPSSAEAAWAAPAPQAALTSPKAVAAAQDPHHACRRLPPRPVVAQYPLDKTEQTILCWSAWEDSNIVCHNRSPSREHTGHRFARKSRNESFILCRYLRAQSQEFAACVESHRICVIFRFYKENGVGSPRVRI
jgi:hypothetical protein